MRLSAYVVIVSIASSLCPMTLATARAEVNKACYDNTDATACKPLVDIQLPRTATSTYDQLYRSYAELAWQDFLSLSIPAPEDIVADAGSKEPPQKPTLGYYVHARGNGLPFVPKWLNFISATDLFPDKGGKPNFQPRILPQKCSDLSMGDLPVLDEYVQANRMGPVVDQQGHFLRFGIGFNKVMYDYVTRDENKLYNTAGQEKFDEKHERDKYTKQVIQWPTSNYTSENEIEAGSIFVKSAWMILGFMDKAGAKIEYYSEDRRKEYFITRAYIYTPKTVDAQTTRSAPFIGETRIDDDQCIVADVGLVGLHIVHRTPSAPQWVWATFEHKDNAPLVNELLPADAHFNLFGSGKCSTANGHHSDCNQLPQHPWNPGVDKAKPVPSQIVRTFRSGSMAAEVNTEVGNNLKNIDGPWKNYFLVDTQFPTVVKDEGGGKWSENSAYPDGMPTPSFLANSTMETYVQGLLSKQTSNGDTIPSEDTMQILSGPAPQDTHGVSGGVQRVTSSCVSCHYDATTTTGTSSNFVFSLSRAKSPQKQ
ncbi:hypothetical protein [Agrobacterium sp. LMR679]|uniref:hypothetical protein n=1 Tax=Agrobacterium sp. LMR679 TaxID=3014335 RepID=UPI0022AF1B5B|nr:hypothetical protein [Agrobacterium sp. LMR679]MCZ4072085.1 hypothetical protein [Agrobacterium sp. LMR679]